MWMAPQMKSIPSWAITCPAAIGCWLILLMRLEKYYISHSDKGSVILALISLWGSMQLAGVLNGNEQCVLRTGCRSWKLQIGDMKWPKLHLQKRFFFPSCQFNTCLTKDSSQISQSIEPIVLFARIRRWNRGVSVSTHDTVSKKVTATYRLSVLSYFSSDEQLNSSCISYLKD